MRFMLIYEILELLISQLVDFHDLFQVLHVAGMVLQKVWYPHVLDHGEPLQAVHILIRDL